MLSVDCFGQQTWRVVQFSGSFSSVGEKKRPLVDVLVVGKMVSAKKIWDYDYYEPSPFRSWSKECTNEM